MLAEIRFEFNRLISIAPNGSDILTIILGTLTIIMRGNQLEFLFGFVTFALSINLDNSISKRSNIIRVIIIQLLTIDGDDDCLQQRREKKCLNVLRFRGYNRNLISTWTNFASTCSLPKYTSITITSTDS